MLVTLMAAPVLPFDLHELRGFCVAADLGSLGRASVRLRVSQPSLSKRLASLEAKAGARLLQRSTRGVAPTPAGRRLYQHAHALLEQADHVADVMVGLQRSGAMVRLAVSHSAFEAFVARMLQSSDPTQRAAVELVAANSQVVRGLVAEGHADIGVAASRPKHSPNPGVREVQLAEDAIVCGVPNHHRWARRRRVSLAAFLATPMVVRDPSSNARWTVDTVLSARGLIAAPALVEAPTPRSAISEAQARNAPLLLSRHIVAQTEFVVVAVESLEFPRAYALVTPAYGEPTGDVVALAHRIRQAVDLWLR